MRPVHFFNLRWKSILVGILLIINTSLFAQGLGKTNTIKSLTAEWSSLKLPGDLPTYYQCVIGKSCMLFADDTSSTVYAFDINIRTWQALLVPTELSWKGAAADGNTAMIWNDSIIVGYSAITNSFSALAYIGTPITLSAAKYGCIDNFAFFTTDQLFYVFDAEDALWRSFNYTPPGASNLGGGVRGKSDYIYLDLWITNLAPHTMVAYSGHTKTFDELTEPHVYYHKEWDHGFTFHRGTSATPYLCGGYSAFTGQFKIKTHSRQISELWPAVYKELVSPIVCNLFVTNEQVDGNIYRHYMWVFNTMIGDFAEYSFLYTYNGSNYVPVGSVCGGQTAVTIIMDVDRANRFEYVVYSAETNSFTHFDTPLFGSGRMGFSAGGSIINGYDEQTYFLYDVQTQTSLTHPVKWTQGFLPGVWANAPANYWSVFACAEQDNDTLHVFSYTRTDGSLHAFDIVSRASSSAYRGSDIYGLLLESNLGGLSRTFLYAPLHNIWLEKDLASTSVRGVEGNYFYANYTGLNQTFFFDAQANREYWFPSVQLSGNIWARDSAFLMYSTTGNYIGYSMQKSASSEYTASLYTANTNTDFIFLSYNVSYGTRYEQLLYDGYNNIFLPLTLTTDHGIRMNQRIGGKTALVLTQRGYLFAYYPGSTTSVKDEPANPEKMVYVLEQNYPNPFNPTTTIKFEISKASYVTLKVYNVLGQEVATLVNEKKEAGRHEIEFSASGKDVLRLASGVYFYRLVAGDFTQTKKFILLK